MPANDMFKIAFGVMFSAIVIYQLSKIDNWIAGAEISLIAVVSTLMLIFGVFSVYEKLRKE